VSTLGMGALSIVWTTVLLAFNPAQNVLRRLDHGPRLLDRLLLRLHGARLLRLLPT
jgi:hypothetical protein